MIHIIVADDMPMQVHTLSGMVRALKPDWTVLEAMDGQEVLALLEQYPVDFVLSDIRMPQMDGLQMLEQVMRRSPKTRVVFLSGYALFEYAQRALKLGAVDFLVKPIEEEALAELLDRLQRMRASRAMRERSDQAMALNHWLYTPGTQGACPDQCAGAGYVAAFYLNGGAEEREADQRIGGALRVRGADAFHIQTCRPLAGRSMLLAVLFERNAASARRVESVLAESARDAGCIVGVSARQAALCARGHEARLMAQAGLNDAFYDGIPVCGAVQPLRETPGHMPSGETLLGWARLPEREGMERLEEALERIQASRPWFIEMIHQAMFSMAELVESLCSEREEPELRAMLRAFAQDMEGICSYRAFREGVLRGVQACGRAAREHAGDAGLPIERCLRYMAAHYGDPLTTEGMASMLRLSPNYFSTLFRQKTGCRFVEYLTKLRMQEAERRIRTTDEFLYKIAQACGYPEERYFIRVYRKAFGCSPAAYRKMHGRVEQ